MRMPGMLICAAVVLCCEACPERTQLAVGDGPAVVVVDPDEMLGSALAEHEPNNNPASAQSIDVDRWVAAQHATANDEDWFQVGFTEAAVVRAVVAVKGVADVALRVFDADRQLVLVNGGGAGAGELLPNLFVEPGVYRFCCHPGAFRSSVETRKEEGLC